jgi:hypothetical protein
MPDVCGIRRSRLPGLQTFGKLSDAWFHKLILGIEEWSHLGQRTWVQGAFASRCLSKRRTAFG